MASKDINTIVNELQAKFGDALEVSESCGETILTITADQYFALAKSLHETYGFDFLQNQTAVDLTENFVVINNLFSIQNHISITFKLKVSKEKPEAPSLFSVWKGVDWQEREIYDMFGITFTGHPNLKRILLDDEFEGFPLRKDFQIATKQ